MARYMAQLMDNGQGQLVGIGSPAVRVLGLELRSSGLVVTGFAFTGPHASISKRFFFIMLLCLNTLFVRSSFSLSLS